ncbi:type I restriction endonuclease subunit M, partial [Escherichia coli]|nr:type I restriction endonuclease subunit M [Escherichia coli]
TMLFLKYISDVWQDHYDGYKAEYGDEPELIEEMMKNERFVLPEVEIRDNDGNLKDVFKANFYVLHERRHEPGNGERIDLTLH